MRPYPISTSPEQARDGFEVRMSDGTSRVFDRYGHAVQFIGTMPRPSVKEQLRASLAQSKASEKRNQWSAFFLRDATEAA